MFGSSTLTGDVSRGGGVAGPILFGRYAYGPNRLGYCGPDDAAALLGHTSAGDDEGALRALAGRFEGAFPYLQLIARANGIADPLDRRVVESYWLGGALAASVEPARFHASLADRFRPRLRPSDWRWLEAGVEDGARPIHAFHVLDVFPRVGLLRGEAVADVLATIDSCRIRPGRVQAVVGDALVVASHRLEMVDGRLRLGREQVETVRRWTDGGGFVDGVMPGEFVAIHWSWACDRLSPSQLGALSAWTDLALGWANRRL